jgi:excisionase family DNA binding protein
MKKAMLATRSRDSHDDLLTQEELAARLKVGLRTLVRLQHGGAVPFIVLGKSVRFYWPAVVSHLNANSTVCVPHGPSPQTGKLK